MDIESIPHRLNLHAQQRPQDAAYHEFYDGVWHHRSWRDYHDEVQRAARAMIQLGVSPGASPTILGFNASSWTIGLVAGMAIGGSPAGIYTTNSPQEIEYIVNHSESPILFIENAQQWEKVRQVRDKMPTLKHVVLFKRQPPIPDTDVLTWEEFLARGAESYQSDLDERMANIQSSDTAVLIYTSGTTGPAKGVMLTHGNINATAIIAQELAQAGPGDRVLSYLPLSHIAEQVFSVHAPVYFGFETWFATSLADLPENLKEVQPTILFGVPRVWEKIHDGIKAQLDAATGIKKILADWALDVGRRATPYTLKNQDPPGLLGVQFRLAEKLIYQKVKRAIGLADNRFAVSGAAPIVPEVLEFFFQLNIVVQEVYGQSEDTGPTSFNRREHIKLGTVGPPVPLVDVKIAEDGEILVKGPNVFAGYYKDPEATKKVLSEDGWLHSGDLGEIDEDGFLKVTGRKKEIIITAGGKNVTPVNIERALKRHDLINEAVVIGDQRKYLTVLLTLEPDRLEQWAKEHQTTPELAVKSDALHADIQAHIDGINQELARVEQVKKFTIIPRNFTVEDGQLTPSLKVKRRIIYEQYAGEIDAMYA